MKSWKSRILEAKSEYQKSLEKKVSELDDVPSSLKSQNKKSKEKDPNQPTQKDWYELKKARFEQQKQQELVNKRKKAEAEKERKVSELKSKASQSIKGIQTQQISKDDKEGTAYKKLVGNVGSAAVGVAGGVGYGIAALAASRKKIEEPKSKQPEMKEPGKPGRPKAQTTAPEPPKPSKPGTLALPYGVDKRKMLPGSTQGGTRVGQPAAGTTSKVSSSQKRRMLPASTQGGTRVGQPAKMVGQPAPQRPALPYGVDKSRMLPGSTQGGTKVGQPAPGSRPQLPGSQKKAAIKAGTYKPIKSIQDGYSDWRQELISEQSLVIEVQEVETKKGKKKKIVDIMKGENKVEINPKVGDYFGYNESYDDETFRQHSRETFSSHTPSEGRKRTSGVLKLMKQMNADVEKPKKKKKKKAVAEECGCEKSSKKKDMVVSLVKALVNAKKKKNFQLNSEIIGEAKSPAWQRKAGKNPEGGLNKKGIASYRKEHPGSKLSLAVTTKPSKLKKGSKSWKRRKSFCARMSGMPGPMKDEKGRPTRKALSLRKWNC